MLKGRGEKVLYLPKQRLEAEAEEERILAAITCNIE